MKKIISKLFLCGALVTLVACNLDRYPETEISAEEFYTNDEEVEYAMIGAYSSLHAVYEEVWVFSELRSDNVNTRTAGSSISLDQQLERFDTFQQTSDEDIVDPHFANMYSVIRDANIVISHLDIVEDADLKQQLEGEARFLRALMYFDLVRLFGEVWYVDYQLTADEALELPLSSESYVYEKIIEDLEVAIKYLPSQASQSSDYLGRATSTAAKGILAKVYLTYEPTNYTTIASYLKEVIDEKGTTLFAPYYSIFEVENEMNDEILFAVRYATGGYGIGSPFMNDNGPYGVGTDVGVSAGTLSYNYPSDGILNAYGIDHTWVSTSGITETPVTEYSTALMADQISDLLMYQWEYDAYSETLGQWDSSVDIRANRNIAWHGSSYLLWCKKYWTYDGVTIKNDGEHDYPVLRYADVLLMYAEVLNKQGNSEAALPYINLIRTRAELDPITSADYSSTADLHTLILNERRMELAFESQRFYDMLREGNDYVQAAKLYQYANEGYYFCSDNSPAATMTFDQSKIKLALPATVLDLYPDL